MDVFIRNLDPQATETMVEEWLIPVLEQVNIHTSRLRKPRGKSFATLTVTDTAKAHKLMEVAELLPKIPANPRSGRRAVFTPSKYPPDEFDLKMLRRQEIERNTNKTVPNIANKNRTESNTAKSDAQALQVDSVRCGRWQVEKGQMVFVPFLDLNMKGILTKRGRALVLSVSYTVSSCYWDIIFEHTILESALLTRSSVHQYLILTLSLAPKLYEHTGAMRAGSDVEPQSFRESRLPNSGTYITGTCLVYQIECRSKSRTETLSKTICSMIPKHVQLQQEEVLVKPQPASSFDQHTADIEQVMRAYRLSFAVRFQLHALWTNTILSPDEVQHLLPILSSTDNGDGDDQNLLTSLRFLHVQLQPVSPGVSSTDAGLPKAVQILSQRRDRVDVGDRVGTSDEVVIHRALVTPTGVYLYGPDKEASNRVIRQYAGHEDCFLRVSFSDESGDPIHFDSGASNERVFQGRFLSILRDGLTIAGEHFSFLGFSHSSLRSQSCWFMRSFFHNGSTITASNVINSLGDFSRIRCPAKCAARIGQAFSDTERAMTIDAAEVEEIPDVKNGRFTFTDGCGTISRSLQSDLEKSVRSRSQPTLYQIRYQGAKGMISLDTRLPGRTMRLRPSMIKFKGSPSNDIEICGTNAKPLPFRLNRQIIKILEDLGIKDAALDKLQTEAVNNLKKSACSSQSASQFLCYSLSNNATGMAELIKILANIDIDVAEDEFIRKVVQALIGIELRELKFRTRIPVQKAVTLYGISDETGFLKEGQVYVTFDIQDSRRVFVNRPVVVTRSPALHPGDIQVVSAVAPPADSPLRKLTNCIVFSQKGARDVPSMLGGGDLDGDLFNIIYDKTLFPVCNEKPAEYEPAPVIDIGRPVTSTDMAEFFIKFMENDQLGRIATLHQVFADRSEGTRSATCLELAKLHSDAVDFSKSGQPVDWRKIPRTPSSRPDFMSPLASNRVERSLQRAEEVAAANNDGDSQYVYYESEHILGKLFRAINEDDFFDELEDDKASIFSRHGLDDVVSQIWWKFVLSTQLKNTWEEWISIAQEVQEYYNATVSEIMAQYAIGRAQKLTEQEVFIGTIVGRSGAGSKRQREQSEMMRARYKREVQDIRQWMQQQTEESPDGYLSLAIACLSLCVPSHNQERQPHFGDHLRSFAWFAAAICIPRLADST